MDGTRLSWIVTCIFLGTGFTSLILHLILHAVYQYLRYLFCYFFVPSSISHVSFQNTKICPTSPSTETIPL